MTEEDAKLAIFLLYALFGCALAVNAIVCRKASGAPRPPVAALFLVTWIIVQAWPILVFRPAYARLDAWRKGR